MHYLDELNEIQRQAVTEFEGSVIINAGPGSGKTRVLTYRIAFMMEQGVQSYNILALTFTNKASKEMRALAVGTLAMMASALSNQGMCCCRC